MLSPSCQFSFFAALCPATLSTVPEISRDCNRYACCVGKSLYCSLHSCPLIYVPAMSCDCSRFTCCVSRALYCFLHSCPLNNVPAAGQDRFGLGEPRPWHLQGQAHAGRPWHLQGQAHAGRPWHLQGQAHAGRLTAGFPGSWFLEQNGAYAAISSMLQAQGRAKTSSCR